MSRTSDDPRVKVIYLGSITQGDLKESVTLTEDGVIIAHTRTRKRPVETVYVGAAATLGVLGVALLPLVLVLGGGVFLALTFSLVSIGVAIYALNHLLFTHHRVKVRTPIDRASLDTLGGVTRGDPGVTRLLLDVASASAGREKAASAAETARERVKIAGPSERLGQVVQDAAGDLGQARAAERAALARLVEFVADEEAARHVG